jgi:proteasome assembly chaperone (PAC2) family protein
MSHVEWRSRPEVNRPVMVCAFGGWNDGGEAASTAVRYLRDELGASRFARVDPEEFFDFQVKRPTVRLVEGITRRIDWPENDFAIARSGDRDLIVFSGTEPNTRWRTYCDALLEVARSLEAELLVTLGAFLADVPHTVPPPIAVASTDPDWLERPGVVPARYEGPTGIVGVLHDRAGSEGLPSVSLWGAAPHYLSANANPRVTLALLEQLRELLDLELDTGRMEGAARAWLEQVNEAIEEDGNLAGYVRRLEHASEEEADGEMPSGDDLAAELERYLRERGEADQ